MIASRPKRLRMMRPWRPAARVSIGLIVDRSVVQVACLRADAFDAPIVFRAISVDGGTHEAVTQTIHQALPEDAWTYAIISIAVPHRHVITRRLCLPSTDPDELRAMAVLQMQSQLPYATDQWIADVLPIRQTATGQMDVITVVVLRDALTLPLGVCERLGVWPQRITWASHALLDWHRLTRPACLQPATPVALLDVNPEHAELVVVANGALHATQAIGRGWREPQLLTDEVARVVTSDGQATRLYATSGHAADDLCASLERRLQMPCEAITGPAVGACDGYSPILAWGAALRPWDASVSLLPPELRAQQRRRRLQRRARHTAAWIGVWAAALTLGLSERHYQRAQSLQALQAQSMALERAHRLADADWRHREAINAFRQDQDRPLAVWRMLQETMSSSLGLTSLTCDAQDGVRVRLVAPSIGEALALVRRWQTVPFFSSVEMLHAVRRSGASTPSVDVELRCQWARNLPPHMTAATGDEAAFFAAPADLRAAMDALLRGLSALLEERQITVLRLQPRPTSPAFEHRQPAVELEVTASSSQITQLFETMRQQLPLANVTRWQLAAQSPATWHAQLVVESFRFH